MNAKSRSERSAGNARPNVLIVLSDQLRRGALGVYGDPDARTPHIDRLAADGVRFANACSTYPICVPFRFTLMTGLYAHDRMIPGIEYRMSPTERTLADEFNEADYETVYIGKWHLDGGHGRLGSALQVNRTPVPRERQGRWQKWYGFELRNDPFDTAYFEDDDPTPRLIHGYQTDGLFDLGMDHLRARKSADRPFCMLISVEPPHNPFVAPPDLEEAWEAREIALPPNFAGENKRKRAQTILDRKMYHAMVENLDMNVGRMRAFLEERGLDRRTIIVFLSDHGELGGAHGLRDKQWPYEESVGVPLIILDPTHADRRGAVVHDPVATEDYFPTILGLAGLRPRAALHGEDLTPLVRGAVRGLDRDGVMLEFVAELRRQMPFYDAVWRAFRSRRYKYTLRGNNLGAEPWQFFDLETDPYEMTNLVGHHDRHELIAHYHRQLCRRIRETGDHFVVRPAFGCDGVNFWPKNPAT